MRDLFSSSSRIVILLFLATAPSLVLADGFSIPPNSTTGQTVTGNDTGTVAKGASLVVGGKAITWDDTTAGAVHLTNDGTIQSTGGRAIDTSGSGGAGQSLSLINNTSGKITSVDDAFRINFSEIGTVTLQNSGLISSDTGQALDFAALNTGLGAVTIVNTATGTIQSGGNDAIRTGDNATINLTNAGTILATSSGSRGIDIDGDGGGTRNITIVNTGLIKSDDDTIRIHFDITGGSVSLDNRGSIISANGQAIDFDSIESDGATINIVNESTGLIEAMEADGVRPGENGIVTNYGRIVGNSSTGDSSDGVDFQDHGGTVINKSGGTIDGAHNGVTGSGFVATFNEKGGVITGHNGSGVNIDGNGSVLNYGLISGNADPTSSDGDGDGVDIDGEINNNDVSIENFGTIEANGAVGNKDGVPTDPNIADGVAFGGGTIINHAGAVIKSVARGIFVDDSNGGAAFGATTITNDGTIEAAGAAITLVGNLDDTIRNTGIIRSDSGVAIDMGGGDDTLDIVAGSRIIGSIDGGAGTDKIILEGGTDSFAGGVNFETLDVKSGIWTLTGTQSYSSGIAIDDTATLQATGILDGAVTVNRGGTLQGNGSIGDLIAKDGSVVATNALPSVATSDATLDVVGDVAFESGSTYKVTMNAAGQSGNILATGAVDLDGHLVLTSSDGFKLGNPYTILTANGGVTGGFVDATANAPRLSFTTVNNADNVQVVATLSGASFHDLTTGGSNQQNIANALDKASDSGMQSPLLDRLNGLDAGSLSNAMTSLTGESHAALTTVSMETAGQFGQAISGRMGTLRSGNPQTASVDSFSGLQLAARDLGSDLDSELAALPEPGRSDHSIPGISNDFWLRGYGSFGQQDGDSNSPGVDYSTGGIAGGYDHHLTENILAGVSFGYSRTQADFDADNANAKINSYDAGLYGSYDTGAFYIDGIVNYSYLRNKAKRDVVVGGDTETADADYSGNRIIAYGEAGYVLKVGEASLQPLGSLQYTWLRQDSFNEHGAGDADLTTDASTMNSLKSGLGLRLSQRFRTGDTTFFVPEVRARWSHEFLDDQATSQSGLASLPGSSFTVKGTKTARDGALVGAGLTTDISSSVAMVVDYDAWVSADETVHNISGGIKIRW